MFVEVLNTSMANFRSQDRWLVRGNV